MIIKKNKLIELKDVQYGFDSTVHKTLYGTF